MPRALQVPALRLPLREARALVHSRLIRGRNITRRRRALAPALPLLIRGRGINRRLPLGFRAIKGSTALQARRGLLPWSR